MELRFVVALMLNLHRALLAFCVTLIVSGWLLRYRPKERG